MAIATSRWKVKNLHESISGPSIGVGTIPRWSQRKAPSAPAVAPGKGTNAMSVKTTH
jgi:hypothetical protein